LAPHGHGEPDVTSQKQRYRLSWSLACWVRQLRRVIPWKVLDRVTDRLSFARSVYGPYLWITPDDRTFELCITGYGRFVSGAIAAQDRPFVFLDIGANLGLFSLVAAQNPLCRRVIAIEPLPAIFRNLAANIRRNAAKNVEPVLGAVAPSSDQFVHLSFNERHSGMSKIVGERPGAVSAPALPAGKLDSLLPDVSKRIVAKIDVEGSELDVLATLRQTRFYPAIEEIIIEVSEVNLGIGGRRQLMAMLTEDGYEELSRAGADNHYDARYRRVPPAG
jgi:FkbM family methyltransferase